MHPRYMQRVWMIVVHERGTALAISVSRSYWNIQSANDRPFQGRLHLPLCMQSTFVKWITLHNSIRKYFTVPFATYMYDIYLKRKLLMNNAMVEISFLMHRFRFQFRVWAHKIHIWIRTCRQMDTYVYVCRSDLGLKFGMPFAVHVSKQKPIVCAYIHSRTFHLWKTIFKTFAFRIKDV